MRDERTPEQKYAAWVNAVNVCHEKGWQCVYGWIFKAPNGLRHDLSGMDLDAHFINVRRNKESA